MIPQLAAFIGTLCLLPYVSRLIRGKKDYNGKHILVTGGSQGIGRAVAAEFVRRGGNVTILARTESKLKQAAEELRALAKPEQKINYVVADTTDIKMVQAAIKRAVEVGGPIEVLISNAGFSVPGYFMDQDTDIFKKTMETNYLGSVNVIKTVVPEMADRRSGQICIVASSAALVSFIGFSSYSPTKWALRGLADSLRNELKGFGISVHISYPPDTATPGFENEEKTKPVETKEFLTLVGGPANPPERVAKTMVEDLSWGLYHLTCPDWLQNRLADTMAGVSPRNNAPLEWITMPLLCIIEWVFLHIVDSFGNRYGKKAKRS